MRRIFGTLGRLMIHWGAWLGLVRVFCFVITSASFLGAGCRRSDPVDVVGITAVDSPVISAASPLELRAEGLPTGRRVKVSLKGRLAAAGQDERALDVSLVGHVLSPERLSVAVDAARIARWGRATFDGEVVVDCDPPKPRGCHGRLAQARFDVELLGERRAQPLHSAVARLLPTVGLEISDADAATNGLLVSEVRGGSLAARAGLRVGDTIVHSNGVRLHALADLAPGPTADALALLVRRAAGQLVMLRVPLADAPPLADLRLFGLCLAASPILLLLFAR
ncbi:MAG TPA: PDZ domain-containing protein, partial [Polyangiales bacterium]|nr:PDZ domain-containing protein [Polyangiales bacterium]